MAPWNVATRQHRAGARGANGGQHDVWQWQEVPELGGVMAVVSLMSAKGGVGKTTLAVQFAVEMAYRGHSVTVASTRSQSACDQVGGVFGPARPDLNITFKGDVDSRNILAAIRTAETASDLVVIDLPAKGRPRRR